MKYLIISLSVLFFSCNEKPKKQPEDFNVKVVDFAIENSNDKLIELPNLYDSLTTSIADDKNEKLILFQILKKKGFEIIN